MAFPLLTLKVLGTLHSCLEREALLLLVIVDTTAAPALYIVGQ